ncbi:MAG: cupin domain-containing protein [Pedobacter sp.]|nr:MAG: cupin domain-containing protein [Pedobacter sp.]
MIYSFNMETSKISRRHTLQCLAMAMGASVIPTYTFAGNLEPKTIERLTGDQKKPIHIKSGTGKTGKIGEGDIMPKFGKDQTDGHLGVAELTLPVGVLGAPPHYHKGFDEICRVTQGRLTIMVGDEIFEVNEGDWHLRPKGIVHSFWNSGTQTAKFIEVYAPAGHENYMDELSNLFLNNQRPKPGDLDLLAKKYDITFDWSKLKTIMDTYKVHL